MAIGDLVGEMAMTYLTPAQRAAQAAKGTTKQASFDATNTPGVVGRTSQQAPLNLATMATAGAAASTAPTPAAQPMSLGSLSPGGATPPQKPAPPLNLADAGTRQTSFDVTNTPAKYMQPSQPMNLSSLSPTGVLPTATSQTYPAPAQQRAADLRDMGPSDTPLPAPMANLESAYRPTGSGQGASAIMGRIGSNGTAEFSNQPMDLASAGNLARLSTAPQAQQNTGPVSLADIMPGSGAAPGSNAELASLGSARNLGDGIGTFSQSAPGDSALSLGRFQKANDLRNAYQDQDRLRAAVANQTRDRNFNVVSDSSRPVTQRELLSLKAREATTNGLADAVDGAQSIIDSRRSGQAADQQQRQALRLEDLAVAAAAPNATPEARAAFLAASDPKGFAQSQREAPLKQLELQNKQLDNTRLQQQIDTATSTQQQANQDRSRAQAGQVATIDQALNSVDSLLGTKVDPKNPAGKRSDEDPGLENAVGASSMFPTLPGTKSADFEARLDTLKAQSFLPQVALLKGAGALSDAEGKKLSDSIGALSPKMSEDAFRKSLAEIRTTFATSKERISGGQQASSPQQSSAPATQQRSAPAVGTVQQGYVFLGGDPASQSSWRAQ